MRPVVITKQLIAAVVNGIVAAQALAAAGNLTLVGGGTVTLDSQRRISILSSGNDSGLTWTVYGTNDAGVSISEAVAGGNAVAVVTLQDFKTVTRIASSGAVAGTVQVGTNGIGSSPWFVLNTHITPFEVGVQAEILSGAVNASIEVTNDSPLTAMPIYRPGYSQTPPVPVPFGWPGLTNLAGAASGDINTPVQAARLTINSGAGTMQATLTQAGIRN